ncbi:MAG: hypothetical protein IT370_36350 [Deltaproteobacteria bacterium]|nr:hypothetical protein [Deltaproteobacteria bacterium]
MPKPPHRRPTASSAIIGFIDRPALDRLLVPWVPDAQDRAFVLRCLLDEGPAHHRGSNYVLLSLLGQLLPDPVEVAPGPSQAVPMRLPPHLAGGDDAVFPLRLPTAILERLAPRDSPAFQAMIDALIDGPPQHALANVAMVCLLSALLEARRPE